VALQALERHAVGLSWVIDEPMARASHALVAGDGVWLVDPVDEPEALAQVQALGPPVAVLQLLDRHGRDCAALAARLGVVHHEVPDALPGSPFEVLRTIRKPWWRESSLWWARERTLVVPEALGTSAIATAGTGPVGVHPFLRLLPPGGLRDVVPEHLLVGHGPPVHGPGTAAAIDRALRRSRRDLPRALVGAARALR
jgi:hypothetical protein